MSEVGGGETLEQVLERLNNRSEYSAVRGTCMCILFVAAWATNLHVFKAAHIDISCIYPPKFLDGLSGGGSSSVGGAGSSRPPHHISSSEGGSRSRSTSSSHAGGSAGGGGGAGSGSGAGSSHAKGPGAGATAAGLASGGGLLLGGSSYPLCHPKRVVALVSALAAALFLCSLLMAELLGQPYQHAPFPFYLLLLAALLYPLEATRPLRSFATLVGRVLWRVVFPRETEVLFLEVLVGDILTSLSKVFHEMGLATAALCLSLWPGAFDVVSPDVLPALFATTPFVLRIRQCSVQARHAPSKRQRLQAWLNILKYCSSLPGLWLPLLLSPYYPTRAIQRALLWALLANSLYAFGWDVVMDWGLGHGCCPSSSSSSSSTSGTTTTGHGRHRRHQTAALTRYPGLRPTLLLGSAWPYYGAMALDLGLRLLWALKYLEVDHMLSYDRFMLLIEALEVFRRGMWSVFRIEWECLSQRAAKHSRSDDEVGLLGAEGDSATDLELSLSASAREEEGLELLVAGGH